MRGSSPRMTIEGKLRPRDLNRTAVGLHPGMTMEGVRHRAPPPEPLFPPSIDLGASPALTPSPRCPSPLRRGPRPGALEAMVSFFVTMGYKGRDEPAPGPGEGQLFHF